MKKIYFHNIGQTVFSFSNGTKILTGLREMSVEFFPKKDNITEHLPPRNIGTGKGLRLDFQMEPVSISFETKIDNKDFLRDFLIQSRPLFHKWTVLQPGFISEKMKKGWFEGQEKGYFFFLQIRQRIYPKLEVEISFLTLYDRLIETFEIDKDRLNEQLEFAERHTE